MDITLIQIQNGTNQELMYFKNEIINYLSNKKFSTKQITLVKTLKLIDKEMLKRQNGKICKQTDSSFNIDSIDKTSILDNNKLKLPTFLQDDNERIKSNFLNHKRKFCLSDFAKENPQIIYRMINSITTNGKQSFQQLFKSISTGIISKNCLNVFMSNSSFEIQSSLNEITKFQLRNEKNEEKKKMKYFLNTNQAQSDAENSQNLTNEEKDFFSSFRKSFSSKESQNFSFQDDEISLNEDSELSEKDSFANNSDTYFPTYKSNMIDPSRFTDDDGISLSTFEPSTIPSFSVEKLRYINDKKTYFEEIDYSKDSFNYKTCGNNKTPNSNNGNSISTDSEFCFEVDNKEQGFISALLSKTKNEVDGCLDTLFTY